MSLRLKIFVFFAALFSAVTLFGLQAPQAEAANWSTADKCFNTSTEYNPVIFVKVVKHDGTFDHWATNFKFSVQTYRQPGQDADGYYKYVHNSIIGWNDGVARAYGSGPVVLESKMSGNSMVAGKGNKCAPPSHNNEKVAAYAFRSGDGTTHYFFDAGTKNGDSWSYPRGPRSVGTNGSGVSSNNGSLSLSCLHLPAVSYRFKAIAVGGEASGDFDDNVIEVQSPGNSVLNSNHDALVFTYRLDKVPDPQNPNSDRVTVKPVATAGSDIEIGSSTTFNQAAQVTGFPTLTEWGYTEKAIQRGVNADKVPVRNNYASTPGDIATGATAEIEFKAQCANGAWRAGNNVDGCGGTAAQKDKWLCNNGHLGSVDCGSNGGRKWRCQWTKPNGTVITNYANGYVNEPPCKIRWFQCVQADGSGREDAYRDWAASSTAEECTNRWKCPSPSDRVTFDPNVNTSLNCKIFRCAYQPASVTGFYEPNADNDDRPQDDPCEYRCNNGGGNPAPLATGAKYASGNLRCYVQPSFRLRCQWDTGATTPEVTVTGDNTYCTSTTNSTISKQGTAIGDLCARTTPVRTTGWLGTAPGWGWGSDFTIPRTNWSFSITPANAQACAKVGILPYVKAFNGDVQSGTYVKYSNATKVASCGTGAGTINTWNKGAAGYEGGATTNSVVAAGNVSGFRSSTSLSQKGLTFANNNSAQVYGGAFGTTSLACGEYTDVINGASKYTSNTLGTTVVTGNGYQQVVPSMNGMPPVMSKIANPALSDGGVWVHTGDLYISGNVTYPAAATSVATLPGFKMIVLGNIYIDKNVTQLAGNYVAVDVGSGTGNIVTCAMNGSFQAVPAAQRYGNCNNRLFVNGNFSAKSVKYLRLAGTLKDSSNADAVTTTNAAEVVNYGPESWLPRGTVPRDIGNSYQVATGLPPVL